MVTTRTLLLCILVLAVTGCAARHPATSDLPSGTRQMIVREIVYNEKGLPGPGAELSGRPSSPGEQFTVLTLSDGRPVESCDIAVAGNQADFTKPFQAVYEWTGKGFEVGAQASSVMAHGLWHGSYSGEEALAALAIVITPVAIGGVSGFVIGVGDGVLQTAVELRKFVLSENEKVLTCTLYDHDTQGRLMRMRMFSPDRKQELVRTTFNYHGPGKEPASTTVESFVEGRQRQIK
jgi:hypothetical protein